MTWSWLCFGTWQFCKRSGAMPLQVGLQLCTCPWLVCYWPTARYLQNGEWALRNVYSSSTLQQHPSLRSGYSSCFCWHLPVCGRLSEELHVAQAIYRSPVQSGHLNGCATEWKLTKQNETDCWLQKVWEAASRESFQGSGEEMRSPRRRLLVSSGPDETWTQAGW